jgi:hypothetical protein
MEDGRSESYVREDRVKRAYNETTRDRNFFRCRQVTFNTGTLILDPRYCKSFRLKSVFRYIQVPFKTGLIA